MKLALSSVEYLALSFSVTHWYQASPRATEGVPRPSPAWPVKVCHVSRRLRRPQAALRSRLVELLRRLLLWNRPWPSGVAAGSLQKATGPLQGFYGGPNSGSTMRS